VLVGQADAVTQLVAQRTGVGVVRDAHPGADLAADAARHSALVGVVVADADVGGRAGRSRRALDEVDDARGGRVPVEHPVPDPVLISVLDLVEGVVEVAVRPQRHGEVRERLGLDRDVLTVGGVHAGDAAGAEQAQPQREGPGAPRRRELPFHVLGLDGHAPLEWASMAA
jgi:hypothetical protein